ncbi:MAG: CPBP family intramembrane metalloprotease [Clostridia bacterium]|nr:CPBP family intramembrane metalloprotease [Clostridia bacterium]
MEPFSKKALDRKNFHYFTDAESGFGVLLFIVLQFFVIYIARFLISSGVVYNKIFSEILSLLIELVFVVCVLIISKTGKKNFFKATGLNKKLSWKLVLSCFIISLLCLFGLSQVSNIFLEVLEALGYHSSPSSISVETVWDLLIYTLLVAVIPAVCEEIMFRGLVLNGLARCGKFFAIIMSAVLFTLMHGSPDQTIHQFILGVVLGFIVYYTGNLLLTIIIHFMNNFIVLVYNFIYNLAKSGGTDSAEATSALNPIGKVISFIISAAIIVLAVYLIINEIRRIVKTNHKVNNGSAEYLSKDELDKIDVENQAFEQVEEDGGAVVYKVNPEKSQENRTSRKAIIYLIISAVFLGIEWVIALVNGFVS